jgi:recombination protein RecA
LYRKSGSWFSYNSDKLGQGRESVKTLLIDNPAMAEELEAKIRAKIKENKGEAVEAAVEA